MEKRNWKCYCLGEELMILFFLFKKKKKTLSLFDAF